MVNPWQGGVKIALNQESSSLEPAQITAETKTLTTSPGRRRAVI
jgi:hypothetical protein